LTVCLPDFVHLQALYGSDVISFATGSILKSDIPRSDLVIARDVLFHMCNDHIVAALASFKASGSRLLVATTHPTLVINQDLPATSERYLGFEAQPVQPLWGFRPVNLDLPPFSLAHYGLEAAEEATGEEYDEEHEIIRMVKLYSIEQQTEVSISIHPYCIFSECTPMASFTSVFQGTPPFDWLGMAWIESDSKLFYARDITAPRVRQQTCSAQAPERGELRRTLCRVWDWKDKRIRWERLADGNVALGHVPYGIPRAQQARGCPHP